MGRYWSKGTALKLCRVSKSRNLMHSILTIVNNTILNPGNLLVDFRCSHHTQKKKKMKRKKKIIAA